MSNLAVLLYASASNPLNAPGVWPKEVQELGESTDLPDSSWVLMTSAEYVDYCAIHRPAYDAWYISYIASLPASQAPVAPTQQVIVAQIPDPAPFAQPTFRTKRDATSSFVEVVADAVGEIEMVLSEERYVFGGTLIVQNAEFGDWVEAYVEDPSGLIPQPYRAALCEAHPIVSKYIVREYVEIATPGSLVAGSVSVHHINTYPLNAKISAGLVLCINYHAVNSGLTRKILVNYHLTKKL